MKTRTLDVPWWMYAIARAVLHPKKALLAVYWDGWVEQAGLAASGVSTWRPHVRDRRNAA